MLTAALKRANMYEYKGKKQINLARNQKHMYVNDTIALVSNLKSIYPKEIKLVYHRANQQHQFIHINTNKQATEYPY